MNLKFRNIAFLGILILIACNNNQTVYSYVVVKPTIEDQMISKWRPVMRVIYHVKENIVISEVAGLLDEYHDCTIQDKYNWECNYKDDRGENTFGFNDGNYWYKPDWGDDVKHVSRWEYNMIRCKWYQHDKGKVKGMISCMKTYI